MPTPAVLTAVVNVQGAAKAQAELGTLGAQVNRLGKTGDSVFGRFGLKSTQGMLLAGAAALGLAKGLGAVVMAASDLGESLNKSRVVFGEASDSVIQFSKDAAQIGIAQAEALEAAAGFGAMAQSAGIAEKESAKMSIRLVGLAADMASFNNQDPSEMLTRLRAGLAGEAEPLRRFGVFLSEARVKAEAYRLGIAETGKALTDAQKVQGRFNLIFKDTAKQQGDFARTTGESLPNQLRILKAELTNVAAEIGQGLLPVVLGLVKALNQLVDVARKVDLGGILTQMAGYAGRAYEIAAAEAAAAEATKTLAVNREGFRTETELSREAEARLLLAIEHTLDPTLTAAAYVRRLESAHAAAAAAALDQQAAELALSGSFLGIAGAADRARDAAIDLAAARKELRDLAKDGKKGTDDWKVAMDALRDAELGSLDAQLNLAGAVNSYLEKVRDGEVTQAEAIRQIREYGKEAGLTKGQVNNLIGQVRGLIGKYGEVPPKVTTTVAAVDRATQVINGVRTALFLLDGSTVTVFMRAKGPGGNRVAEGGIARAQHGMIARGPTLLVGEGQYATPFGRGAEAILPLDSRGIGVLATAIGMAVDKRGRSDGRPGNVHLNFYGPTYGLPDFNRQVEYAVVEALSQ